MIAAAAAAVALMLQGDRSGSPSSALERALAERACDVIAMSRGMQPGDHEKCVDDQLASLRDDLGVNLGRLSAGDRLKLDSACSALAGAATREAYLDCVGRQLAPLRERLRKAKPAAAESAVPAADAAAAPIAAAPPAAPPPSRWRLVAIAGGSLVVLAAAAAGAVVVMKKRKPAAHVCRSCGTPVSDAGALCANCRHAAAEALRRAAAERAAEAEEAARREKEAAEAAAQLEQRQQEAARQAALEAEAKQREAEEAAQHRENVARQGHGAASAAGAEESFDAHAILGVAKDAGPEAIRAAYEEAKAKYDPEHVSHLSPEVQQHYREKAEAVERAFHMLSNV